MASKHRLKNSIYQLLKKYPDGSFETQGARKSILMQLADTLNQGGYKLAHVRGIKQKHVKYLVGQWQSQDLSDATIKNRMSHIRWLCGHLGKDKVVLSNDALGIGRRQYKAQVNKAVELTSQQLGNIKDPYVKLSVALERHFGLRREESIKIKPHIADSGTHLCLHTGWTKGGRVRMVPIQTAEARYWLDEAKQFISNPEHSLIPQHLTYKQQRDRFDKEIRKAGIKNAHGLRHAYAQQRYRELTGWEPPVCGGPTRKEMTVSQKKMDRAARLKISEELGHSRIAIVSSYLA